MNFKKVRKKIRTVQNISKITREMQMMSAIKMKKAQAQALEGTYYRTTLERILKRILTRVDLTASRYLHNARNQGVGKEIYILIASNKGLCGGFNFNLERILFQKTMQKKDKDVAFITIGKKGAEFIMHMRKNIIADFSSTTPFSDATNAIFSLVKDGFLNGTYGRVFLAYNHFISTFKIDPVIVELLPITDIKMIIGTGTTDQEEKESEYLFEPSVQELIDPLIDDFLREKIRMAILQSEASEHSSRMIAMKNATDNAQEVVYTLTILRNKLRQETITSELLDMISAKESTEIH